MNLIGYRDAGSCRVILNPHHSVSTLPGSFPVLCGLLCSIQEGHRRHPRPTCPLFPLFLTGVKVGAECNWSLVTEG
jgi:hypothetical protein